MTLRTIVSFGIIAALGAALAGCAGMDATPGKRQLMIVGNDEKVGFDAAGKQLLLPPGKDTVLIIDIGTDPLAPKILASLPLMNSIFGPPVNLAITPDEKLALVANSMNWVQDSPSWKPAPDDRLYVIALAASPQEGYAG
jgi:hypothetical protein